MSISIRIIEKSYLSLQELMEVQTLEQQCLKGENLHLKLELEERSSNVSREHTISPINEFLAYYDDTLVGYLSISCWGANIGEITGMVHPDYRRNHIFTALFQRAKDELHKRSFRQILLLVDQRSLSGQGFITSQGAKYHLTERQMILSPLIAPLESSYCTVSLTKALPSDYKEIHRQNQIYFDDISEVDDDMSEFHNPDRIHYLSWHDNRIIGKVKLSYSGDYAYLSGFGILPEYRGKGLGRATFAAALGEAAKHKVHQVGLDVVGSNRTAFTLYESFAFTDVSAMDYYEYIL